MTGRHSTCIYIDGENISSKYWDQIETYIMSTFKGSISIKRIYYDITKVHSDWSTVAYNYNIEQIHVDKMRHMAKNSSDIRLVVDVLGDLYEKEFLTTFIIVSSDTDFGHLIRKVKSQGKYVVVVSNQNTNIASACDHFVLIKTLLSSESDDDMQTNYYSMDEDEHPMDWSLNKDVSIVDEVIGILNNEKALVLKKKKLERQVANNLNCRRESIDLLRYGVLKRLRENGVVYEKSTKKFRLCMPDDDGCD